MKRAPEARPHQALAGLSSQPSGSRCRHGVLRSAHDYVRRALCFFVISHDRRRILHVNVTKHPTSGWITQQLRKAFPFKSPIQCLIFDRDRKLGFEVIAAVNGIAERRFGNCGLCDRAA